MDSKLRELVDTVTKKTQRGKVHWRVSDSEAFRTQLGFGQLLVLRGNTTDFETGKAYRYVVSITNSDGQVVLEAEATERQDDVTTLALFQALFDAARTAALGGYEVIDSMLEALEATS